MTDFAFEILDPLIVKLKDEGQSATHHYFKNKFTQTIIIFCFFTILIVISFSILTRKIKR